MSGCWNNNGKLICSGGGKLAHLQNLYAGATHLTLTDAEKVKIVAFLDAFNAKNHAYV